MLLDRSGPHRRSPAEGAGPQAERRSWPPPRGDDLEGWSRDGELHGATIAGRDAASCRVQGVPGARPAALPWRCRNVDAGSALRRPAVAAGGLDSSAAAGVQRPAHRHVQLPVCRSRPGVKALAAPLTARDAHGADIGPKQGRGGAVGSRTSTCSWPGCTASSAGCGIATVELAAPVQNPGGGSRGHAASECAQQQDGSPSWWRPR